MLKIRNLLLLFIVLALAIAFVGCNKEAETTAAAETETETSAPAETVAVDPVEEGVMAYFANKPAHNYKIPQQDFVDKVRAGEDMFILDIRQPDVYAEGHAKGAVNAPWGPSLGDTFTQIPMDKPVMVYCYTGQTAGQAVMTLNLAGFEAYSVNLGWNLGISKVEGVEDIIETAANDFPGTEASIDIDVLTAIREYYSALASAEIKNNIIAETALKERLDAEDPSIYVLSIRSAEHYGEGHIAGAANIPWSPGMERSFDTLPEDKTVVVYCYTGQTAGQTVAGLRLLGYDAVSLRGGMGMPVNQPQGWSNQGYPVVQ